MTQCVDEGVQPFHTHAIHRVVFCPGCQRTLIAVQFVVGSQKEILAV